jgi:hypothetical protein
MSMTAAAMRWIHRALIGRHRATSRRHVAHPRAAHPLAVRRGGLRGRVQERRTRTPERPRPAGHDQR